MNYIKSKFMRTEIAIYTSCLIHMIGIFSVLATAILLLKLLLKVWN